MFYHKYKKYKEKYNNLKTMINNNLYGGVRLDIYIDNFFKTYNFISWTIGEHIYKIPNNDHELDTYCQNQHELQKCDPPYDLTNIKKRIDECCEFKGVGISKKSIYKFNIETPLIKDNIHIQLIKQYDRIATPDYRQSFRNYINKLIIEKLLIANENIINQVIEIIKDDESNEIEEELTKLVIIEKINNGEIYNTLDILAIVYPDYRNDPKYNFLYLAKNSNLSRNYIQEHNNKLFLQTYENNKIYYFYFSYGNIKFLDQILWEDELKIYVEEIKKLLKDNTIDSIILAGHSIGSIVIQHLGIELIKNNIDISKIFIIGSACPVYKVLEDEEITIFKNNYNGRYCFIVNSYIQDNILYFDSKDESDLMNKLNTHILLCADDEFKNDNCNTVGLDILDIESLNGTYKMKAVNNIRLHDFKMYANFYFNRRNYKQ